MKNRLVTLVTVMLLMGVALACATISNGAALLTESETAAVTGGCSTHCRNWECGGPAHDCGGVGEGNYCNLANPSYQCTGDTVIPDYGVLACNTTDPDMPDCLDGPQTYCGTTNICYCDMVQHACISTYMGTSGWYNPCLNPSP